MAGTSRARKENGALPGFEARLRAAATALINKLNLPRRVPRAVAAAVYRCRGPAIRRQELAAGYRENGVLFPRACATGDPWLFHDEEWIRVRHRREHRRRVARGLPLDIEDILQERTAEVRPIADGWVFAGHTRTRDEWIYLHLDPGAWAWRNYRWQMRVRRLSHFRELQFGFRYRDFYNRYRFRFEDNRLYFDKVHRGQFHNNLACAPMPMELGRWYEVQIDCRGRYFTCAVDGQVILDGWDHEASFAEGSIAVILWENNGSTDIRAEIASLCVRELTAAADPIEAGAGDQA